MKTYVVYHANCWDGFCAAWVARGALKDDPEFIAAHYGHRPPTIAPGCRVFILDFCFPRNVLLDWWIGPGAMSKLVILDHHKTAAEALCGFDDECRARGYELPQIVFDMEKSGGRLAWEFFHGTAPSPWLVDYTEDRDLWRWRLERSREINAFLRSWPLDFGGWDQLNETTRNTLEWESMVNSGRAICRTEEQIVLQHVRNARPLMMDGHEILAVNATVLFSEIAGELAKGRPFGACYFDRQDGKRQWSLRSREGGVDVAEIAKKHGGGGHAQAAGFEQPMDFPYWNPGQIN